MKIFACRDLGFDCNEVIQHPSEEVVLEKASAHLTNAHSANIDAEKSDEVRSVIREI